MTLAEAVIYGEKMLRDAGIAEASLDAWYLLEYVMGISRAMYFADSRVKLEEKQEKAYQSCIERRAARIPLQHITGVQEFMGLEFQVNEHVLIPRQDTECLVEEALLFLKPGMRVLDMCTGSGCILISLLKLCEQQNPVMWKEVPTVGVGVDISADALEVARNNGKRLQTDVLWKLGDLFQAVEGEAAFDLIVSNPPYIRTEVIAGLEEEVRLYDPWLALDGKEDGLYFYRRMTEECGRCLKKGGRLLFEIGHDQAEAVTELMEKQGFQKIYVKKDLAGLDRVVSGVYNN
ncbi:MAG TPA: peptide chain release factor N(5)-glutamine methyltransferase [Lachnospiraceae bacterium]|nr:peptide chain release factor N(5)-glutamine methyltransferase [Lachnospiraceae bacterium]